MTRVDLSQPDSGRRHLLEAAGQVFAELGYQRATVRTIVKHANVSLGAVNYHFRDKAGLYREVLALAHEKTTSEMRQATQASDPEDRLYRFVKARVGHALCQDSRRTWAARVLSAEFTSMSDDNRDELFERFIAPIQTLLYGILRDLLPPAVDDDVIASHGVGLMGQCLIYCNHRQKVEIVFGRELVEADLDWLSRHITNVTLAGIKAEADRQNSDREE